MYIYSSCIHNLDKNLFNSSFLDSSNTSINNVYTAVNTTVTTDTTMNPNMIYSSPPKNSISSSSTPSTTPSTSFIQEQEQKIQTPPGSYLLSLCSAIRVYLDEYRSLVIQVESKFLNALDADTPGKGNSALDGGGVLPLSFLIMTFARVIFILPLSCLILTVFL